MAPKTVQKPADEATADTATEATATDGQATDAQSEKKKRVKKTYAPLDLAAIVKSAKRADPSEAAKLAPARFRAAERSDTQKQFDTWYAEMYADWEKAGKNSDLLFTDKFPPFKVFGQNEAEAEAIRIMVQGSAKHAGHGYKFGTDTPTTDGGICVSWYAVEKVVRQSKKDTAPATDAPAEDTPAEATPLA